MVNKNCLCSNNLYTNLLLSVLASAIADDLNSEELNYIANIYTTLGQNLFMIDAQKQICKSFPDTDTER